MAKKYKKSIKEIRNIIAISISICLIIYGAYRIVSLMISPTDIFILEEGTISKIEATEGYVIREESIIDENIDVENIQKIKNEGEKIAVGATIFKYYTVQKDDIVKEIEATNTEIQQALSDNLNIFSSDIKALEGQIESKLATLRTKNNVDDIQELKTDIDTYIIKKAKISGELSPTGSHIKELMQKRNTLEQQLLDGSKTVTSNKAGVVSYRIDGLETKLTVDNYKDITVDLLEELGLKTGKIISTSETQAKIVNNFECYIAIISSSDEANNAKVNDKVYLQLSNSKKIRANIEYIKEDGNKKILIFKVKDNVEDLIGYRKVSIDIIWWERNGLKVPNTSIIYDNGKSYVVKKNLDQEHKILIKIQQTDSKSSIISNYGTDELIELGYSEDDIRNMRKVNLYDEIVANPTI